MARMDTSKHRAWLVLFALTLLVCLLCAAILTEGQGTPPLPSNMTVIAEPQLVPVNGSTVLITVTVYDENGSAATNTRVFFNNSETNLGNLSGGIYMYFEDLGWQWTNYTNAAGVATIVLTSGSQAGIEKVRVWVGQFAGNQNLDKTVSVTFTAEDTAPPLVTNPSATPSTILSDTGRVRAAGTNSSQLNVTVTDEAGVASVTIDLTAIGGSAAQPLQRVSGTAMNGVWSVTTSASTGINATHALPVNATDLYGKSNNAVSVTLAVRRRGDVVQDNVVDMKDALYIARFTVGLEPEASNPPSVFIADVVGNAGDPAGDGRVDMKDALYIARWVTGLEPMAP